MSENPGQFSLTAPVVMAFPSLFEAKAFKRNGKEVGEAKYGANFVFPQDSQDLKDIKNLMVKLARAKWPAKDIAADIKANMFGWPITNGNKLADKRKALGKEDGEYQRGCAVIAARSKFAVRLAGFANGKVVDFEPGTPAFMAAKGTFYPGVQVLAQFNFVPYDRIDKPGSVDGVAVYLNMVLTTNKGTRLSGGQSAAEAFKGYVGSATTEDPTGGALDDEIPF